ncbi:MAG: hypothetical protein LBQ40_00180 [Clostridiales bacterium]|jgi:hypothetical protein|nr:hypothetical protein [Clostridiales bacterium]
MEYYYRKTSGDRQGGYKSFADVVNLNANYNYSVVGDYTSRDAVGFAYGRADGESGGYDAARGSSSGYFSDYSFEPTERELAEQAAKRAASYKKLYLNGVTGQPEAAALKPVETQAAQVVDGMPRDSAAMQAATGSRPERYVDHYFSGKKVQVETVSGAAGDHLRGNAPIEAKDIGAEAAAAAKLFGRNADAAGAARENVIKIAYNGGGSAVEESVDRSVAPMSAEREARELAEIRKNHTEAVERENVGGAKQRYLDQFELMGIKIPSGLSFDAKSAYLRNAVMMNKNDGILESEKWESRGGARYSASENTMRNAEIKKTYADEEARSRYACDGYEVYAGDYGYDDGRGADESASFDLDIDNVRGGVSGPAKFLTGIFKSRKKPAHRLTTLGKIVVGVYAAVVAALAAYIVVA